MSHALHAGVARSGETGYGLGYMEMPKDICAGLVASGLVRRVAMICPRSVNNHYKRVQPGG
jgi:hypothetical protein